MGKASKRRKPKRKTPEPDALEPALDSFALGDHRRTRRLLAAELEQELSEGERGFAAQLLAATRLERGTVWVGLGCAALFLLVILVSSFLQP